MTDDAFENHGAFEAHDLHAYAVTTTPFEATVTVDGETVRLSVWLPTLDATVADETVAPVVADGWYDTLQRRLSDVPDVTSTAADIELAVSREDDTVVVETAIEPAPGAAADDAKAIVDFVEGTWVQGVVPGYDYEGPAAQLLAKAKSRGGT
jgi:hypothetical protein